MKCAEDALVNFPDMDAYYSTGNLSAVGAAQIFPEAGRDDIIVAGVDNFLELKEAVDNEILELLQLR